MPTPWTSEERRYYCESPTSPPEKIARQDTPIPSQDIRLTVAPSNPQKNSRSVFKDFQTSDNNHSTPFRQGTESTNQQILNIVQAQENSTQIVLECLDDLAVRFNELGTFTSNKFDVIENKFDVIDNKINDLTKFNEQTF